MAKPKMTEDIIKKGRRDLSEQEHFKELRKGLDDGTIKSSKNNTKVSSNLDTIKRTFRIPGSEYDIIREHCFKEKISINTFVTDLISKEIVKLKKKGEKT